MPWVMSHARRNEGYGLTYTFYIGSVALVEFSFFQKKCVAIYFGHERAEFDTMSLALTDMHRRLNSPPPEDAEVGFKKKELHSEQQPAADETGGGEARPKSGVSEP